ncbi:25364_t:CDS:2, partial [Racocetra persica]
KLPNIPSFSDTRTSDQGNIRKLDETDRKALHKYLIENQEKMAKDLQTRRVKSINPASSANIILDQAQTSKQAWDKISTLLAHLGPPAESQKKDLFQSNNNRHFETNHQLFTEFMHRNANRSVDSIISKSLFYDGALSKERRQVFYLILRRFEAESTDMDLLMYHILQVIEPYISKPYELLVDVTQFGQANEIQFQWVQQFVQILPFNAIENLAALYFYNPNKELHQYIAPQDVRLPNRTMQLDTDLPQIFSPVIKISHYRMQVPVTMKISNETIQIITQRRQEIFNGLSCYLNDVYHISEIEDVVLSSHRHDDEFIIKQDLGRPTLAFTSPKKEAIIQAIRSSKARYQIAKPTNITERVIRPNDVPGTLLNMALLNIGSEDPNLRLAAYNLLVAL